MNTAFIQSVIPYVRSVITLTYIQVQLGLTNRQINAVMAMLIVMCYV